MDKDRKEFLEWLVNDFSQKDLTALKPGDKAKLIVEVDEYLSPRTDLLKAVGGAFPVILNTCPELKWVSNLPRADSAEYWKALTELQAEILSQLTFFALPRNPEYEKRGREYQPGQLRMGLGSVRMLVNWVWGKNYDFAFIPAAKNQKEYVRIKLYQILQGLPSSTVQNCPGCQKIFLNFTLRQKKFCSPRCMWRVIAKNKREAQREKYNEQQAQKMWERYPQKVKKEHPNAKVQRRVNRIKDEKGKET